MNEGLPKDLRAAITALGATGAASTTARSITSDLSIDETLLLHQMGFGPADLVTGFSIVAIPYGTFLNQYGQSEPVDLPGATNATLAAFTNAIERMRDECQRAGGIGVVGVEVKVEVAGSSVSVALSGTAINPLASGQRRTKASPFVTDLSVRDYALLTRAGWGPLELVIGAGFVAAPPQRLGQVMSQARQNVELPNITLALQRAREQGMERMQQGAIAHHAAGVVDVTIIDGPLGHSHHVCAFICFGTAIELIAERHQLIEPQLILPLDDSFDFEATALRGD